MRISDWSSDVCSSDLRSAEELELLLTQIVDRLARRLRDHDRTCRTVVLRLRFGDYTKATRSRPFRIPSARARVLPTVARGLLAASLPALEARGTPLFGTSLKQPGRAPRPPPQPPH